MNTFSILVFIVSFFVIIITLFTASIIAVSSSSSSSSATELKKKAALWRDRMSSWEKVRVETTNGILEGAVSPDGKISVFLGVRYALPANGSRRWMPPVAVPDERNSERDATWFAPSCLQNEQDGFNAYWGIFSGFSSDCLAINIYIPGNISENKKLTTNSKQKKNFSVAAWIYGGGLAMGSASGWYDGYEAIVHGGMTDTVLVTIGYRLGWFGFLGGSALLADAGKLNVGLLDQALGLQWIAEKNAAAFNIDSNKVLFFGESAGGASSLLALTNWRTLGFASRTNRSNALFTRVLSESGSYKATVSLAESTEVYDQIAKAGGCPTAEMAAASVACMRALPDKFFFTAGNQGQLGMLGAGFGVVIDGASVLRSADAALKLPGGVLPPNVDAVALGSNRCDSCLFNAAPTNLTESGLLKILLRKYGNPLSVNKILTQYSPATRFSNSTAYPGASPWWYALSMIKTDASMTCRARTEAMALASLFQQQHQQQSEKNVFVYNLHHATDLFLKFAPTLATGHMMDLLYVFFSEIFLMTKAERELARNVVGFVSRLAERGVPSREWNAFTRTNATRQAAGVDTTFEWRAGNDMSRNKINFRKSDCDFWLKFDMVKK